MFHSCFKGRKVVNHSPLCLNCEEPVDGAAELIRTLLPVSEVPLDISVRTHNKPVLIFGVHLPFRASAD